MIIEKKAYTGCLSYIANFGLRRGGCPTILFPARGVTRNFLPQSYEPHHDGTARVRKANTHFAVNGSVSIMRTAQRK